MSLLMPELLINYTAMKFIFLQKVCHGEIASATAFRPPWDINPHKNPGKCILMRIMIWTTWAHSWIVESLQCFPYTSGAILMNYTLPRRQSLQWKSLLLPKNPLKLTACIVVYTVWFSQKSGTLRKFQLTASLKKPGCWIDLSTQMSCIVVSLE